MDMVGKYRTILILRKGAQCPDVGHSQRERLYTINNREYMLNKAQWTSTVLLNLR